MPLLDVTIGQLRAAGWSEEKIAAAARRKEQREENGLILDAFIRHYAEITWGGSVPLYDDLEVERDNRQIFVRWHDPEHMRHCEGPRVFHAVRVNNVYGFEEV